MPPRASSRATGYSDAETHTMLEDIRLLLPIGAMEWEEVERQHASKWPGTARTADSIRRKFQKLYRVKIPTGDPKCPPAVREAKRIRQEILQKADCSDGEDEEELAQEQDELPQFEESSDEEELTSNYSDRLAAVQRLYHRILRRGHSSATIKPYFQCALQRQANSTVLDPYDPAGWEDTPVFFHVRYHPLNPSRRDIQRLFRSTMIQPPNEPKLGTLRNNLDYRIYIDRLIIAFSRGLNLKNILFPRTLRDLDNKPPSSFLQRE